MAILAARAAGEVSISNWTLLVIRQKETTASKIASRIHFKVPTSQRLLGRFCEIINVYKIFSTWNRAPSQYMVASFIILPYCIHSLIH